MRIDILTVLPGLLQGPFSESIVKRGIEKNLVEVHIHDIREFSKDKHKKVDDTPFGGSAGMVLAIQPLHDAITKLQSERQREDLPRQIPTCWSQVRGLQEQIHRRDVQRIGESSVH